MISNKHTRLALPLVTKLNRRQYKKSLRRKRSTVTIHKIIRSQTHGTDNENMKTSSVQRTNSSDFTKFYYKRSKCSRSSVKQFTIDIEQSVWSSHRINSLGNIHDLIVNKKNKRQKRRNFLYAFFCIMCCILCLICLAVLLFVLLMKSKVTATTVPSRLARFYINMLINGNGETGPCEMGGSITSPTGWNHNGPITQYYYNNSIYISQAPTTPGPSDRGNCYFSGQTSAQTAMWQTIDLNNYVDQFLVDSQTVRFNLSAWIGGWGNQDDHAVVSLIFYDQFNQIIGNRTSIGPVLSIDRSGQTSLLFRQANGLLPIGTRNLTVLIEMFRLAGSSNSGDVDNICVSLY